VLDDGTTQLYTYAYDAFGHVTNSIDPVGRTFTYIYATDRIDLLQFRQTRAGNNELNSSATYNSQHLPSPLAGIAPAPRSRRGESLSFVESVREPALFPRR
jgi:YD repeat-containing protein